MGLEVKLNTRAATKFEKWCNTAWGGGASDESLEAQFPAHGSFSPDGEKEIVDQFVDKLVDRVRGGGAVGNLQIGCSSRSLHVAIDLSAMPIAPSTEDLIHFGSVTIIDMKSASIKGSYIGSLNVGKHVQLLKLEGCWIKQFSIGSGVRASIELKNCWIGKLRLGGARCAQRFSVFGGTIRSIDCPTPGEENPFGGSVLISSNVAFPTSRKSSLFQGAQGYRNLRSHLEKLENAPASNLMRRLELETERHFEDSEPVGVNFVVSWIYGFFSDYGLSPGRPLLWILCLWILASGIVFLTDGGAFIVANADDRYFGWREVLVEPNILGKAFRSVIPPIQSAFNPLGIFGSRLLITANEWWTQIWLSAAGLFIDALLLMSIFGVRKRFKLH